MFLTAYEKEKETNNETELLCPWGVGCRTPFLNLNKTNASFASFVYHILIENIQNCLFSCE